MLPPKSATIFDSFKPIFYTVKLFGILPFSIDFDKHSMRRNALDILQLILMTIAWSFILIFRYMKGISVQERTTSFAKVGGSIGTYSGFVILISNLVGNSLNRYKLMDIMTNLEKFDRKVSE